MGNALCKEPRTGSTPSTGSAFSNFSSVICPNGLGKGKTHPMRKTYFTRSAVDASKKTTSATGWQSVGLFVPDGSSGREQKVIDTPPVAPPRKKRGATLDGRYRSDDALQVKNGFQDVFGRESRRHSCDIPSVTRPASVPPPRPDVAALPARQTSCFEIDASNDAFSDFSKVPTTAELEKTSSTSQIPRVGNRKSDKFFGERLADSLSSAKAETQPEGQKKPRKEQSNSSLVRDDVDKIEKFVDSKETSAEVLRQKPDSKPSETQQPSATSNKAEGEDLMKYIDRTVAKDNQIGRRAEFLMAMLEDYNDSVRYEGMQPVEEPMIVPKRRKSKHICDDHDHMHDKLHAHERDATASNVIQTEASIEQAPRKPSRDFSRYKPIDVEPPSSGGSDGEQSNVVRPARTKQKGKQRESASLSPPPAPPRFQKSHSEIQFTATSTPLEPAKDDAEPKAHTPRMLKRIISMPTTENLDKPQPARPETPQRPVLTKSSSSGSFSAVDMQRSRICVERFTPEDFVHRSSGADELIKPKSKLTTRKISWKSNEPPICRSPTPTADGSTGASFTIGGTTVVTSDSPTQLAPPAIPARKRSDASTEPEVQVKSAPSSVANFLVDDVEDSSLRQFCLGSFIESSKVLPHHDVVNVLDCVYSATDNKENIIEQFQTFLEEALTAELNEPNPTNPNVSKLLEKLSHTSSDDDKQLENVSLKLVGSTSSSSEMDDCFDPEFEKIEKSEIVGELPKIDHGLKHGGAGRRRDSIEYMSDWFAGESDGSTTMLSSVGADETIATVTQSLTNSARRESINDVGGWFSNHNVLRPSFGEEFEEPSRRLRRGSDGFLGYDMQRQYPFGKGRQRSDSLSAEMFEDITKLHEQQRSSDQQEQRPIPQHPQRKKVLEHRNSSDALLMKVLTRSNRAQQHHNDEEQKQSNEQEPHPSGNGDESKPLLNESLTERQKVTESTQVKASSETTTNKDEPLVQASVERTENDEHEHTEHSTLLKFLSKEKLIE
uniref:Microtubule-associated protein futsch n=1 Tax=Anopheles christyi TaxID=43041 RepID=A0A182K1J8_9DIPT